MRNMLVAFVMCALASAAEAQRRWSPEVGIQGGFSRVKPSGTGLNDEIDIIGAPGGSFVIGLLTHGTVYALIPVSNKIALEPSFNGSQLTLASSASATTARYGLRADYALSDRFYAAGGGSLLFQESSGQHATAFGLQLAAGYRLRLSRSLSGRIEAQYQTTQKDDNLAPFNVYSLLFGVSTRVSGAPAPAPARRAVRRAWTPALGISGGYFRNHEVGGAEDLAGFSLPGLGGVFFAGSGGNQLFAVPPTMFLIIPIGQKLAVEPGFDLLRVQSTGTTAFSGNLSARLNYAVTGGWYGAAGGNLNYLKATGSKGFGVWGANVAWGYRFRLVGAWGGRAELNYTMMSKNNTFGIPPQNVLGVMFGATVPLQ